MNSQTGSNFIADQNRLVRSSGGTFLLFILALALWVFGCAAGVMACFFAYHMAYPHRYGGALTFGGTIIGMFATIGLFSAGYMIFQHISKRDVE